MEIQSFILCKEVASAGVGTMFNGHLLGITSLFPTGTGEYPIIGNLKYFMVLRRSHRAYDENFSLRFDLVDEDGRPAGQPTGAKHNAIFPAGARFFQFYGSISFEIPAPGDYRLDITADEEGTPFVYAYNIEATEKPEPPGNEG
jgi:hypothetical protein